MLPINVFSIATFISAIGDTLLLVAVPIGLGVENNDIRMAVLMWLVPAIAMFCSSFLGKKIASRANKSRTDYAFLLASIGTIELLFSVLTNAFPTKVSTIVLVSIFVFFYALLREGVPRLLYMVSVYRYFCKQEEYAKISGRMAGLTIAATLIGTSLGALLIHTNSWRYALLIDAITFLILAGAIYYRGHDVAPDSNTNAPEHVKFDATTTTQNFILWCVPTVFGVNALCGNYLALIANHKNLLTVLNSIGLIAVLRLPGMLSGLSLGRITKRISPSTLVITVGTLLILANLLFTVVPSYLSIVLLIFAGGLYVGIFIPSDLVIRSTIPSSHLISFNTSVLRRMAISQFAACIFALGIYQGGLDNFHLVPLLILFIAVTNLISLWLPKVIFVLPIAAVTWSACIILSN